MHTVAEGRSTAQTTLGSAASQQDRYDASQSESQSTGSGAAHSPGTATSAPPEAVAARTPEHVAPRGAARPLSTLDRPLTADVGAVEKRRTPDVQKRPATAHSGGVVEFAAGGGSRPRQLSSPADGVNSGEWRTSFGVGVSGVRSHGGKGTPRQVDEDLDAVMPSPASNVTQRQGEMHGEAGGLDAEQVDCGYGTAARMSIPKLNLLNARAPEKDSDAGAASPALLCLRSCSA